MDISRNNNNNNINNNDNNNNINNNINNDNNNTIGAYTLYGTKVVNCQMTIDHSIL